MSDARIYISRTVEGDDVNELVSMKGNALDLMYCVASIMVRIEKEIPESKRSAFRADMMEIINAARRAEIC